MNTKTMICFVLVGVVMMTVGLVMFLNVVSRNLGCS